MKPPFSYYGGKQRMASKIIPFIPKHTVYAEPFCGGATLLFRKPWPDVTNNNHYREYINDTNELVINFFRQLRDSGEKLCGLLNVMPMSESEYKLAKHPENEPDNLKRAYYFFTNIQQSFSNKLGGGWRRSVYARNEPATWAVKKPLFNYIERMQSIGLTCSDALKFIKQYDSPQTFFYCDPPYPGTELGHYKGYTEADLQALVTSLNSCKGSAIVSCYAHDHLFEGWNKHVFKSYCYASGKGKVGANRSAKATGLGNRDREEVIYIKQASPPREEIQKLYDSGKFDCFEGVA